MICTQVLSTIVLLILTFSGNRQIARGEELKGDVKYKFCSSDHRLDFCFQDSNNSANTLDTIVEFSTTRNNVSVHFKSNCDNCEKLISELLVLLKCLLPTSQTCVSTFEEQVELVEYVLQEYFQKYKRLQQCNITKELIDTKDTVDNSKCWKNSFEQPSANSMTDCVNNDNAPIVVTLTGVIAVCIVLSLIAICGMHKHGKRMMYELENDTQHRTRLQPGLSITMMNNNPVGTSEFVEGMDDTPLPDDMPMPDAIDPSPCKPSNFPMIENPLNPPKRTRSIDSSGYAIPAEIFNETLRNVVDGHVPSPIKEDEEGYLMPNEQSNPRNTVMGYFTRVPSIISETYS